MFKLMVESSPSLPEICEFEILHSELSSKIESQSDSSRFWLLVITLQGMCPYPALKIENHRHASMPPENDMIVSRSG